MSKATSLSRFQQRNLPSIYRISCCLFCTTMRFPRLFLTKFWIHTSFSPSYRHKQAITSPCT